MNAEEELNAQLVTLKMVIFDVDGVLTDGRLYYGANGEELKVFHVLDGHGLKQLMRHDIVVGIISGRDCDALRVRLNDLGIKHFYLGQSNKIPALEELIQKTGIQAEHIAYMGDDEPDLAPMTFVGTRFAPSNAISSVKDQAHWVSSVGGGQGAVREVCDLILHAKNKPESID